MSDKFCQQRHGLGWRCVLASNHPGPHDPQPPRSATVIAIERQERREAGGQRD